MVIVDENGQRMRDRIFSKLYSRHSPDAKSLHVLHLADTPVSMDIVFPVGSTTIMPMLERFHISAEQKMHAICGRVEAPYLQWLAISLPLAHFDEAIYSKSGPPALKHLLLNCLPALLSAPVILPTLCVSPNLK